MVSTGWTNIPQTAKRKKSFQIYSLVEPVKILR
uniref:Uncharacterized protein n=1 Tax=Rhizophora mucronata TaxID=61149 RepID=A0A2P2NDU5_RHIMU